MFFQKILCALAPGLVVLKFVFTNLHKNMATEIKTPDRMWNEWKQPLQLSNTELYFSPFSLSQLCSHPHETRAPRSRSGTHPHGPLRDTVTHLQRASSKPGRKQLSGHPGFLMEKWQIPELNCRKPNNSWAEQ